jgi:two-component system chemotaxis response regulator CheY
MRFLIIDDSEPMRRILTNVLARLGHSDVTQVTNGREALARLESEQFDVIITDWFMPEMNGFDFLRTLRARDETKDIPIIVVTGNGSKNDVARAVELKISGYVLKPFTAETFKERINAVCETLQSGRRPETAAELAALA